MRPGTDLSLARGKTATFAAFLSSVDAVPGRIYEIDDEAKGISALQAFNKIFPFTFLIGSSISPFELLKISQNFLAEKGSQSRGFRVGKGEHQAPALGWKFTSSRWLFHGSLVNVAAELKSSNEL